MPINMGLFPDKGRYGQTWAESLIKEMETAIDGTCK